MTAAQRPQVTVEQLIPALAMSSKRTDELPPFRNDGDPHMFGWSCTFRFMDRRLQTGYWMGLGHVDAAGIPKKPKKFEVFDNLISDASYSEESFEEWCAGLGYDTDSRRAYRTYEACVEVRLKLIAFLGEPLYKRCLAADRL